MFPEVFLSGCFSAFPVESMKRLWIAYLQKNTIFKKKGRPQGNGHNPQNLTSEKNEKNIFRKF